MESGFWYEKTGRWFLVLVLGLWARVKNEKSVKANGFGESECAVR